MVFTGRIPEALFALAIATLIAMGLAGCSSLEGSRADCNIVRLQRESGRSDAEIASALGVSVGDVATCQGGAPGVFPGSEAMGGGMGAGMGGGMTGGEAGSAPAPDSGSAPAGPQGGDSGGSSGGSSGGGSNQ